MKMKSLLLVILATLGLTASTMAQNLPNYVSSNGLVSWWPFNGNAVDESVNDNDGIVNGALLTEDRFGYINKAYKFNGINNYIEILNNPNQINNTYSISIWIENDSLSSFIPARYILNKGCSPTPSYRIYYENDGNIEQYLTDNWSPIRKYVNGPSSNNQWTHLVSIYDGNFLKLYVNGTLFGSISQNGNITTTTENLLIGCGKNTVTCQLSAYYSGKIDDIGIWNRALTEQEITDLYNGNSGITGFNSVIHNNTIKIFPNPANNHITIDYGNFATLNGYELKIENSLGQQLFQTKITQKIYYLSLSNLGGNGLYFVHIIDAQGNTIDIRKIVLQ